MNRCICCINITWNQFPLFCQPHTVHSPGSLYPLHINSQSPPLLSPSITPSALHSRLKALIFHKSFAPLSFWLLLDYLYGSLNEPVPD